jgi:hypothetical protein
VEKRGSNDVVVCSNVHSVHFSTLAVPKNLLFGRFTILIGWSVRPVRDVNLVEDWGRWKRRRWSRAVTQEEQSKADDGGVLLFWQIWPVFEACQGQ